MGACVVGGEDHLPQQILSPSFPCSTTVRWLVTRGKRFSLLLVLRLQLLLLFVTISVSLLGPNVEQLNILSSTTTKRLT